MAKEKSNKNISAKNATACKFGSTRGIYEIRNDFASKNIYILGPRAHFGWNIRISSSFWKPRVAIKLTKKLSDV